MAFIFLCLGPRVQRFAFNRDGVTPDHVLPCLKVLFHADSCGQRSPPPTPTEAAGDDLTQRIDALITFL